VAIFNYLIIESFLVAGFFAMAVFTAAEVEDIPYAKNILAGAAFAFGTAMVAHVYLYDRGIRDLLLSREFIGFAVLCMLNISAIDLWEHANRSPDPEVKATDELSLTLPLPRCCIFSTGCGRGFPWSRCGCWRTLRWWHRCWCLLPFHVHDDASSHPHAFGFHGHR
jgi:hypothetical protein